MILVNESVSETRGDPARKLQQAFGDSLYSAADRLAQSGGVLEVRVLQGGNVVTGIVGADAADATPGITSGAATSGVPGAKSGAKYRVYIRGTQRECNCGDRRIDG